MVLMIDYCGRYMYQKRQYISFISDIIESSSNNFIFKEFYYFDKLPSTQDFALNLLKEKKQINPSVIICNIKHVVKEEKDLHGIHLKGGFGCLLF